MPQRLGSLHAMQHRLTAAKEMKSTPAALAKMLRQKARQMTVKKAKQIALPEFHHVFSRIRCSGWRVAVSVQRRFHLIGRI
jgi:hypothetical protein